MKCLHCNIRKAKPGYTAGLCHRCSLDPEIRALFPSKSKFNPNRHWQSGREPTEAELDAMIAERMKTLPAWWNKSNAHED